MKTITLNECGGWSNHNTSWGCGGGGSSYTYGGCSPDFSPRTLRILFGPKDKVKKKMNEHAETTKQAFNQRRAKFIWDELCRAQWNVEWVIKAYNELIDEISNKMQNIKDKEKIKVGKQAIAEMKRRIPKLKKIYDAINSINNAEIAIPCEKGNKVFVI